MAEKTSARSNGVLRGAAGQKGSGRKSFSVAIFGVTAFVLTFFSVGPAAAAVSERAKALHKVCEAAAGNPSVTIITDSDSECVFSATAGYGNVTYYTYFSGENFCERTVLIRPDAPNFDRTVCGPAPIPAEIKPGALSEERKELLQPLGEAEQAIRVVGKRVDYVEGSVQLLREGGTMPVTADIPVEPGDVVLTGKTGFVELISDGGATWLSGDSTYGLAEIGPIEKPKVIAPDEPLDPQNFQLDELSWWEKVERYFSGMSDPDVYTAAMYGSKKSYIVYRGAAYFEERTDGKTRPAMVVTPTAAIAPNGTAFLVEVEKDGTTTVTTLDGQVLVADLKSGKVVTVNENQAVTVPKTLKGLSAKELERGVTARFLTPIDRWWFEKITEKNRRAAAEAAQAGAASDDQATDLKNKMFFAGLAALLVAGVIVSSVIKSRTSKKT